MPLDRRRRADHSDGRAEDLRGCVVGPGEHGELDGVVGDALSHVPDDRDTALDVVRGAQDERLQRRDDVENDDEHHEGERPDRANRFYGRSFHGSPWSACAVTLSGRSVLCISGSWVCTRLRFFVRCGARQRCRSGRREPSGGLHQVLKGSDDAEDVAVHA